MDKYERIVGEMQEDNIPVYYYEGKPYRVLHEGKTKPSSILKKVMNLLDDPMTEEVIEADEQLAKCNKGSKWIDIVVYEPLYEECDIKICVKEKEDFYNNYKPKSNEDTSTSNSTL